MKILTGLFISILFLTLTPSFASAASCQCSTYSTGVAKACEQKSESECYAQLNVKTSCSFFTDDACKTISAPLAPGLAWSKPECDSAKGDWIPKTGETRGPYCFEKQDFSTPYNLSVDILGTNKISNLGQYVNLLYKLVMGLAIFFAIIMTTIAGFMWLTAGGNAGKIGEAKKKILNAIIGLLLAVGAYTILQTINPRLLELHLPLIPKIKTLNYAGVSDCGDYKNSKDCLANLTGVNQGGALSSLSTRSGTGCGWKNNKCVRRAEANPGDNGGRCLAGDTCNSPSLQCVSTITVVFTSITKLCSSGDVGTSCGPGPVNDGCKEGLKCEPRTHQCIDPAKKLPNSAACSKNEECSGGRCLNGACANDCTEEECAKKNGEFCLLKDGGPATECHSNPGCPSSSCDKFYDAGTTFCPAQLYKDAPNDLTKNYLKNSYDITGTGFGQYSSCYQVYRRSSGGDCAYDIECKSKKCIASSPGMKGTCQ